MRKYYADGLSDREIAGRLVARANCVCALRAETAQLAHDPPPDHEVETMEDTVVAALSQFPSELVKTITCDRRTEFANWAKIEESLHCDVYFAPLLCLAERYQRVFQWPASGGLSQGQKLLWGQSENIKTSPGVDERQDS